MHNVDEGDIYIDNINITTVSAENRQVGFVYQYYLLFPHLSVRDNISFGLRKWKSSCWTP